MKNKKRERNMPFKNSEKTFETFPENIFSYRKSIIS